jgi:transposase
MDEPECPGCRDHLKRLAELEARVAELTRKLEEATRVGKRQAAPFRKGPPKPDPKKPGRKSGKLLTVDDATVAQARPQETRT